MSQEQFEDQVGCPYCGETIHVLVDTSAGDQHYIEDCQVCCRPIEFLLHVEQDGDYQLTVFSENE